MSGIEAVRVWRWPGYGRVFEAIYFEGDAGLYRRSSTKRIEPRQNLSFISLSYLIVKRHWQTHIPCSHALLYVPPNSNIVWEFLLPNFHLSSIGRLQPPPKMACPPYKRPMPFNLPAFNRGRVDCHAPDISYEENTESKKCDGVGNCGGEEMG